MLMKGKESMKGCGGGPWSRHLMLPPQEWASWVTVARTSRKKKEPKHYSCPGRQICNYFSSSGSTLERVFFIVCMCVHVCTPHKCRCPWRPEDGVESSVAGVGCVFPNTGAGN